MQSLNGGGLVSVSSFDPANQTQPADRGCLPSSTIQFCGSRVPAKLAPFDGETRKIPSFPRNRHQLVVVNSKMAMLATRLACGSGVPGHPAISPAGIAQTFDSRLPRGAAFRSTRTSTTEARSASLLPLLTSKSTDIPRSICDKRAPAAVISITPPRFLRGALPERVYRNRALNLSTPRRAGCRTEINIQGMFRIVISRRLPIPMRSSRLYRSSLRHAPHGSVDARGQMREQLPKNRTWVVGRAHPRWRHASLRGYVHSRPEFRNPPGR